jgi:hypothetical protein
MGPLNGHRQNRTPGVPTRSYIGGWRQSNCEKAENENYSERSRTLPEGLGRRLDATPLVKKARWKSMQYTINSTAKTVPAVLV